MIASEISLGLGLTCTDQLKLTPWGQRIALPFLVSHFNYTSLLRQKIRTTEYYSSIPFP